VNNTARYLELFAAAIDRLLPNPNAPTESEDILDILYKQKKDQATSETTPTEAGTTPANNAKSTSSTFPQELRRR
jgi:hypothetical protein